MKCPFCGDENIGGVDACENCGEDLTAFDGVQPEDSLEEGLIKDPLLAAATCHTWSTPATTSVAEVAQKMDQNNQCCLVMEGKELVGIVTERDILQKFLFKGHDLKTTPIVTIMTPKPEILHAQDNIVHALNKMAMGGYRHIPVLKSDGSYQVISVRDVLAYLAHHLSQGLSDSKK